MAKFFLVEGSTGYSYESFCPSICSKRFYLQNPRKEVNAVLKKEAEYFGDIVILPFMDRYDLVVLKTIAICEYGVSHIMFFLDQSFSYDLYFFPPLMSFLFWFLCRFAI